MNRVNYIVAVVAAMLLVNCGSADQLTVAGRSASTPDGLDQQTGEGPAALTDGDLTASAANPDPPKVDTLLTFRTNVYVQSAEKPIRFQLMNISRRSVRVDLCTMLLHRQEESRWQVVPGSSDCREESERLPPGKILEDRFELPPRQPAGLYRLSVEVNSPESKSVRTIYSNPFRLSHPEK